jgi:1,4-dihydroxy-2-naphthoate octaprenyltransferase
MVRLGWRTAMRLHDAAIAFALLAMLFAAWNGLPPRVAVGSIIALPLAAAQVWQMHRLRQGFRPQWRSLTVGAMALFALTSYLELAGYILAG